MSEEHQKYGPGAEHPRGTCRQNAVPDLAPSARELSAALADDLQKAARLDAKAALAAQTKPCDVYDEERVFTYHAPKPGQAEAYESIRAAAKELALLMRELCPLSRELACARTNLEQAVMWVNAGIARNGGGV